MASSDLPDKIHTVSSSLSNGDLLTIIGVIIALAAYISSVRGRILDKVSNSTGSHRELLKKYAKRLMFADIPLTLSGLILVIYTGLKIFLNSEISVLLNFGMSLFAFALIVLAIFHSYEWYKSFNA